MTKSDWYYVTLKIYFLNFLA